MGGTMRCAGFFRLLVVSAVGVSGCGSKVEVGEGAVIFLGDSLTSGHGLPREAKLYPEILGEKWGRRTINLSSGGMRADQALERYGEMIDGLETDEVAAGFIVLGANDQLAGRRAVEAARDLRDIAEKMRVRGWKVFVVQSIVPLRGGSYGGEYLELAKRLGTPLSQDIVASYLRRPGGTSGDGVHPSGEGHTMIAETLDRDFGHIMAVSR
jgi:lysophospholipase L1-like esterase